MFERELLDQVRGIGLAGGVELSVLLDIFLC